jgi:hypothetical protein
MLPNIPEITRDQRLLTSTQKPAQHARISELEKKYLEHSSRPANIHRLVRLSRKIQTCPIYETGARLGSTC